MKRDMDLIRGLLLKIEESSRKPSWKDLTADEDQPEAERILEHLKLIEEAGFTKSIVVRSAGFRMPQDIELTWDGHEFLDSVRSPETWTRTKAAAAKVGGVSLSIMSELAKATAKSMLKEHLGLDLG